MFPDLHPQEAHLRDVSRRVAAVLRLEREAYLILDTDPFQPEIVALLDVIGEQKQSALHMLRHARRQLRLACPSCLRAAEHDLTAWSCAAHLDVLAIGA